MIKRVTAWLGFALIRLGWCIYNSTEEMMKMCLGATIESKSTKYSIEFNIQWRKAQRKAKLEKQIKKHEEEISRLQYEIEFKLR